MNSEFRSSFLAVLSLVAATGCSGVRYYAHPLDRASEAVAKVDVRARSGVSEVTILIDHVIPPNRVHAGSVAYYAWTRSPAAEPWTRLGLLGFNPSGHDAVLRGTAPDTRFDLLVTIEDEFEPTTPSAVVFLAERIGHRGAAELAARPMPARTTTTSLR